MVIRSRNARTSTREMSRALLCNGSFARLSCLALACLLIAVFVAGCAAANGTFSPTGSMITARGNHTATVLPDGRVLIAGGLDRHKEPIASAELYDPKTGTFSATASMASARAYHSATLLANCRALIAGGRDGSASLASAELYDPKTGTFTPTGSMSTGLANHTATLLSDGRILLAGGFDGSTSWLASAELYDPANGSFHRPGSMTTGRNGDTATLLSDGRVLVTGGAQGPTPVGPKPLISPAPASAELYDPATGTFRSTGSMSIARGSHTATLLADGRVLIAGGPNASAEIYDPKSGAFSPAGSMTTARGGQTATTLSDGLILMAGGSQGPSGPPTPIVSAELYDPRSGGFGSTTSMSVARANHTATLLPDGRVLIAGGEDASVSTLDSAELFRR